MDLQTVRAFFMWCTIINGAMFLLSFVMCVFAGDWVYRMNRLWFPISRETFNVAIYAFIGLYKIFVLMFNLIPYIALVIVG